MSERGEHILERAQLERALTMLRDEQQANPITPVQKKLFLWFQVSFWGFWISYAGFIVFVLIAEPETGTEHQPLTWLAQAALALMMLFFVSLFVSLFWNWRMLRQTWRRFRLTRRTGLWKAVRRQRRRGWLRVMGQIALVIVLLPALGFLVFPHALLVTIFVVPAYIFLLVARRRLRLIADAHDLDALLTERVNEAAGSRKDLLAIPTQAFGRLAEIEEARIQRRREEAIDALRTDEGEYALLKTGTAADETRRLDEATRLRVEARLDRLANAPVPPEAWRETAEGTWHVPIPDTGFEILYGVDEEQRRVDVLSIRARDRETIVSEPEVPDA